MNSEIKSEKKKIPQAPRLNFDHCNLYESVRFKNVDLSKTSFLETTLENTVFNECGFFDEKEKIYNELTKNKNYKEIKNIYRQLKKNFDNRAEYQEADRFYVGEMRMRLKELSSSKSFSWEKQILNIYKYISFFNTKPQRALGVLIIIILLSTIIYLFTFAWDNIYTFAQHPISNFFSHLTDIGNVIAYSITSSVPVLKQSKELVAAANTCSRVVNAIQVFISIIIWTLLVLAIRRKFKR